MAIDLVSKVRTLFQAISLPSKLSQLLPPAKVKTLVEFFLVYNALPSLIFLLYDGYCLL